MPLSSQSRGRLLHVLCFRKARMSLKISLIRGLPLIKFMRLSWDLECCHIELSCMLLHCAFQTCSQVTFLKTTTGSQTGREKSHTEHHLSFAGYRLEEKHY